MRFETGRGFKVFVALVNVGILLTPFLFGYEDLDSFHHFLNIVARYVSSGRWSIPREWFPMLVPLEIAIPGALPFFAEFCCKGRKRYILRLVSTIGYAFLCICVIGEFLMAGIIGLAAWSCLYLGGLLVILRLLPTLRRRLGMPEDSPADPQGFDVVQRRE